MRIPLDLGNVQLIASDGITASLHRDSRRLDGENALRMDVSYGGSGYASVRVPVAITLPPNYRLSVAVSGELPENTLEVKFVDPTQDFVWWINRPHFAFTPKWQNVVGKKRHFWYAWGPNREPLTDIAFIELTVTASSGGKGSVYFAGLDFEEIPLDRDYDGTPVVTASSNSKNAANVLTSASAHWHSAKAQKQECTIDFGQSREFGGLVIDWGADYALDYSVQTKQSNGKWHTVDTVNSGKPGRQYHYLPETDSSAVRIKMKRSSQSHGYSIKHIEVMPLTFGATVNEFMRHVAADSPVGHNPRYMQRLQSFWTVVGVSGGTNEAIINEEGMVEIGRQTPSIEPFLFADGKLLGWNEGTHEQHLEDGYLPVPHVVRTHESLKLEVAALAHGEQTNSCLYVRYLVTNTAAERKIGKLYLTLRPLQVNPPWQFLNIPGGFSPVKSLSGDNNGAVLNEAAISIKSLTPADAFGATSFSQGDAIDFISAGQLPKSSAVHDENGLASAVFAYDFDLAPGATKVVDIAAPWFEDANSPDAAIVSFDEAHEKVVSFWRRKLDAIQVDIPAAQDLLDTMKAQVAYILINRNQKAIQPGSRCYRRTWIRDGSLTSTALLQNGCIDEVRDFIKWFSPFQYPSGKVPCCVDKRGSDPTPEHDSHGEYIYLVAEYYRYTADIKLVRELFPHVLGATKYIDSLRQQRRTDEYQSPDKKHLFGLMPESISHEGYSAKPMHSYWDDIFTHKGLVDAVFIAELFPDDPEVAKEIAGLQNMRDEFHADFIASIKATMLRHNITYIPGCADLGDFDATSTTIGLDPDDLLLELPVEVRATFDKYWEFFQQRRDGGKEWYDYTPYEWRNVGAFLRLGEVERAHEAMEFFMSHRRPAGWKHWCEVVYKNRDNPGFIGDAPHGWVASDYLRSMRNLLAYEAVDSLIVGAGIKPEWLELGVTFSSLQTHHGEISMIARNWVGDRIFYDLEGKLTKPVFLVLPGHVKSAVLNHQPLDVIDTPHGRGVLIKSLPATILASIR
ncbi:MAG: discoidin domain-containing protein [Candidatus Obscuribacterales bacterium]|nr:discoidin domain-containing protein [Candidatus Obscuribacterales bacterium]